MMHERIMFIRYRYLLFIRPLGAIHGFYATVLIFQYDRPISASSTEGKLMSSTVPGSHQHTKWIFFSRKLSAKFLLGGLKMKLPRLTRLWPQLAAQVLSMVCLLCQDDYKPLLTISYGRFNAFKYHPIDRLLVSQTQNEI